MRLISSQSQYVRDPTPAEPPKSKHTNVGGAAEAKPPIGDEQATTHNADPGTRHRDQDIDTPNETARGSPLSLLFTRAVRDAFPWLAEKDHHGGVLGRSSCGQGLGKLRP
jgi:hypothetical protein